jgi:hypothetical protein
MSEQFPGGLISKTPVTPAGPFENGAASGIWTLEEAYQWTADGLWPTAGNVANYYTLFGIMSDQGFIGGAVTTDSSSNTYLGTTLSTGSMGSTYPDDDIVWVSKWPDGGESPTWQRSAQDTSLNSAYLRFILVDSTGDVLALVTAYDSSDDFCTILKWDTDGTFQWGRNFGTSGAHATGAGFALDSSDNIYILTNDSTGLIEVAKWNSAGVIQTQYHFQGYSNTLSAADGDLAVDSSDYLIAGVKAEDSSGSGANVGNLARFTSTGTVDWSIQITDYDGVRSVTTDSSDNAYAASSDTSSVIPHISKFNSSGTRQWARKIAGSATGTVWSQGVPEAMAVDSSDNLYVLGRADINNTGTGGVNKQALIVFKYNSSGVLQWSRYIQSNQANISSQNYAISIDGTNFVVSTTAGAQDSGNKMSSIFINLPTDGSKTGTYTNTAYTPNFIIYYYALDVAESEDTSSAVSSYSWSFNTTSLTEGATGMTSATGTLTWDNEVFV